MIPVISKNSRTDLPRQEETLHRDVIVAWSSAVDGTPAGGHRSRGGSRFHGTYNVFADARVCTGTHQFPADPARVPEAFFQSFLSVTGDTARNTSRKHPDDVGQLWAEIDRQPAYPLDDLVPALRVRDAFRIGE